jgi:hypothetical protein
MVNITIEKNADKLEQAVSRLLGKLTYDLPIADNDLVVVLNSWQIEITRIKNVIKKKKFPNHGKPWKDEHEVLLLELFMNHMDRKIMEHTLGRTWRSIHYHLSKLFLKEELIMTRTGLALKYHCTETEIAMILDPMHNTI